MSTNKDCCCCCCCIKSMLSIAKQESLRSFLNIESDSLFLIDIGKLFQRRASLGKKDDLNNSVLA